MKNRHKGTKYIKDFFTQCIYVERYDKLFYINEFVNNFTENQNVWKEVSEKH